MAITITHPFVSVKGDGGDATLVRPSNWNAAHTTSMATSKLIGRTTAGVGAFEELALSAFFATLLNSTDTAALLTAMGVGAFTTGDGKLTFKTVADASWVMMDDGTIGDATSGASTRANADCSALFVLFYALSDTDAPLLTSAGAGTTRAAQGSAATAFGAHCRMTLPKQLGRAIVGAGSGSGLTARTLGSKFGAETHTLSVAELASHYHSAAIYDPAHTHGVSGGVYGGASTYSNFGNFDGINAPISAAAISIAGAVTNVRVNSSNGLDTTYSTGSTTAHNNTQASTAWNVMVKL